jgi:ornithine carrier protein
MVYASGIYSKTEALPLPALFFTGAAAGAVTSLVLTPVELIKCKMQVPVYTADAGSAPRKPTISATIKSVFRHQGITGFWHGQFATFLRETGGGAAWFGSKEAVSALFRKHNIPKDTMSAETEGADKQPLPLWQQAVAGAAAGMSYNFLFFPADTVKSRMQTAAHDGGVMQTSFWVECTALWKQAGLRGMYRGCGITVFRSAPSSAFIFIIYDGLKSKFSFS